MSFNQEKWEKFANNHINDEKENVGLPVTKKSWTRKNDERVVAVYARVSTEHEAQMNAFENQIQYYKDLVNQHPKWNLYKIYSDEGVTGTSVQKRKGFMQMLEDAKAGKFDLIVIKEISRFARNTKDTLQKIDELKGYGVEVHSVSEDFWSMDSKGEVIISLMAAVAQDESARISQRVKIGQMMSFKQGVLYGNGNILGYDRVGKNLIINPEQAETVRMIYDMYLNGMGMKNIAYALERAGRLTSTGKTHWDTGNISRILRNPFYCGVIVYRKQYVPEYLEQKKINNFGGKGSPEKIVIQGTHETIVTEEEFFKVQSMITSRPNTETNRGMRGYRKSNDVWCNKLKCSCGAHFQKKLWHNNKSGLRQMSYQCYSQVKSGSKKTRANKGLSVEGICEVKMIPEWKLGAMTDVIFQKFCKNPEEILALVDEMLTKHLQDETDSETQTEMKKIQGKIEEQRKKLEILLDMRLSEIINTELFEKKQSDILKEIESLEKVLASYQGEVDMTKEDRQKRLESLKHQVRKEFNFETHSLPDEVIDTYIDQVEVYKDSFVFKLNLFDDDVTMKADGRKTNCKVSLVETPSCCVNSSGSDCRQIKDNCKYMYFTAFAKSI